MSNTTLSGVSMSRDAFVQGLRASAVSMRARSMSYANEIDTFASTVENRPEYNGKTLGEMVNIEEAASAHHRSTMATLENTYAKVIYVGSSALFAVGAMALLPAALSAAGFPSGLSIAYPIVGFFGLTMGALTGMNINQGLQAYQQSLAQPHDEMSRQLQQFGGELTKACPVDSQVGRMCESGTRDPASASPEYVAMQPMIVAPPVPATV